MTDLEIVIEDIQRKKRLWEMYCLAISVSCDTFISWKRPFLEVDYIKEKLDLMKQVNTSLRKLYKKRDRLQK